MKTPIILFGWRLQQWKMTVIFDCVSPRFIIFIIFRSSKSRTTSLCSTAVSSSSTTAATAEPYSRAEEVRRDEELSLPVSWQLPAPLLPRHQPEHRSCWSRILPCVRHLRFTLHTRQQRQQGDSQHFQTWVIIKCCLQHHWWWWQDPYQGKFMCNPCIKKILLKCLY